PIPAQQSAESEAEPEVAAEDAEEAVADEPTEELPVVAEQSPEEYAAAIVSEAIDSELAEVLNAGGVLDQAIDEATTFVVAEYGTRDTEALFGMARAILEAAAEGVRRDLAAEVIVGGREAGPPLAAEIAEAASEFRDEQALELAAQAVAAAEAGDDSTALAAANEAAAAEEAALLAEMVAEANRADEAEAAAHQAHSAPPVEAEHAAQQPQTPAPAAPAFGVPAPAAPAGETVDTIAARAAAEQDAELQAVARTMGLTDGENFVVRGPDGEVVAEGVLQPESAAALAAEEPVAVVDEPTLVFQPVPDQPTVVYDESAAVVDEEVVEVVESPDAFTPAPRRPGAFEERTWQPTDSDADSTHFGAPPGYGPPPAPSQPWRSGS
ncbi:MAG: hypothetical protein HOW97_37870, partial [Catenulispora sp.]|nr:hypothetical protein [Catenulispora sp.]